MGVTFGGFVFDPDTVGLSRDGQPIDLEPQVFELLKYLIANADRVIGKDELIENIWDGRIVSDAALSTRIRDLRRALEDDGSRQNLIKTYPKRGYQFVGRLETDPSPEVVVSSSLTPAGQGRRLALLALVAVVGLTLWQWFPAEDPQVAVLPDRPSVAVLPFNVGSSGTDPFIAEGIAEDIIGNLSRFRELFVISRNTSFMFLDGDPRQVGGELGVAFVARGTVRRIGETLRVQAELVDSATGAAVWTERFDGGTADLFALQDEISAAIAAQLVPEITRARAEGFGRDPTNVLSAWDLFLTAKRHQTVYSREGQERAITLAMAAIEKDPTFAMAHSLIARAKGAIFFFGWSEDADAARQDAIGFAERALELDKSDPVAHAALGYVFRFTGEEERAIANLERAAELNPNDATIRLELAHTLDWFRHQSRALPHINAAIELSPRDPMLENMYFYKAHILYHLGRYNEALEATDRMSAVLSTPTWKMLHSLMRAAILVEMDLKEDAAEAIAAAREVNPNLSLSALKAQFDRSKNHPKNREIWLTSLQNAGLDG